MHQSLLTPTDGTRVWFGLADYEVLSPDRTKMLRLPYVGEPPHGDSQHAIHIGDWSPSGYAWGDGLSWSPCSRYVALDWAPERNAPIRKILILDLQDTRFLLVGEEARFTRLVWPVLSLKGSAGANPQESEIQLNAMSGWTKSAA